MSHWFAKWFGCGVVILCVDGRFSFSFALKGNWRFPFWNRAMNWDFRGRKWKAVSVDNDNQNRIGFLSKVFKVNGPFHHHHHHHQPTNRRYIVRAMNDCSCMAFWKRDRKVFCMQIFQLVILMTATDNNSTILTSKVAYSIFLTFTQFYIISLLPFLLHISTFLFLFFGLFNLCVISVTPPVDRFQFHFNQDSLLFLYLILSLFQSLVEIQPLCFWPFSLRI